MSSLSTHAKRSKSRPGHGSGARAVGLAERGVVTELNDRRRKNFNPRLESIRVTAAILGLERTVWACHPFN